jgi:hypothetical protein
VHHDPRADQSLWVLHALGRLSVEIPRGALSWLTSRLSFLRRALLWALRLGGINTLFGLYTRVATGT